jgi:hypothetical protein
MPSEHRRLRGSSQVPYQTRGHPQSSQLPSVEPPPRRAARGDTTPGLCSGRDLVARAPCQVKQPCAIYICATRMCSGECLRRLTTRLGIRGRVHTRPSLNAAHRARSEAVLPVQSGARRHGIPRRAVRNESSRRVNSRPTPSGAGAQNNSLAHRADVFRRRRRRRGTASRDRDQGRGFRSLLIMILTNGVPVHVTEILEGAGAR